MKRRFRLGGAAAAVVLVLTVLLRQFDSWLVPALSSAQPETLPSVLILDAGHGGEDGGAVSVTGVSESQINLAIVLKLDDILGFYGVVPVLLRSEDISLHDPDAVTMREKKVSDLKNRAEAIQQIPGATLISIHQNTYQEEKYHGAQTFYAPTQGSQELAEQIQETLASALQPDNTRQAKQIPDTVYLMNHISCRAVLVECGFLTNHQEEAMLRDGGYQKKLACVLCGVWLGDESPSRL